MRAWGLISMGMGMGMDMHANARYAWAWEAYVCMSVEVWFIWDINSYVQVQWTGIAWIQASLLTPMETSHNL